MKAASEGSRGQESKSPASKRETETRRLGVSRGASQTANRLAGLKYYS